MPFLYEKIDTLREVGVSKELVQYIPDNLNPSFELRPYQTAAFENFITYFENDKLCQKPTQTLFHMATGSGKTLIMAGLMLYLYEKTLFYNALSDCIKKGKLKENKKIRFYVSDSTTKKHYVLTNKTATELLSDMLPKKDN